MTINKRRIFFSLRNQIFFCCAAIILVCNFFMLWMIQYSENQIKNVYYEKTLVILNSESEKLSSRVESLQDQLFTMLSSNEFAEIKEKINQSDDLQADTEIVSFFSMVFESWENKNDYIKQVFAVTPTDMYFTLSTETLRSKKDFDDNVRAYLAGIDTDLRLYSGFSMENVFYQTAGRVIPMVYTYKSQSPSVMIQFVFLLDETYLRLQMSTGDTIGTLLIVDENGMPVIEVKNPVIKQMLADEDALSTIMAGTNVMENVHFDNERFYTICCNVVGNTKWKLVGITTEDQLLGTLNATKTLLLFITVVMFVISLISALLISNVITKPLFQLRNAIMAAPSSQFNSYFRHRRNDVVGDLASSYNGMLDEIRRLIAQLEEEKENLRINQLMKRRAELKALQAQINPHFLYNTLDSINWMAINANQEDISTMAVCLAELFRAGLKRGNELSPLRDEISHVSNYLAIQKMRYGDKFTYKIEYEPEVLEQCYGMRLLLQPLAENSIYHSIKPAAWNCHILIRILLQDTDVIMDVEDDGIGFEEGKMAEINQKLADHVVVDKGGYGVFNVNERIHLYFGPDYGLTYSMHDGKTIATIRVPNIDQKEAQLYDQYSRN